MAPFTMPLNETLSGIFGSVGLVSSFCLLVPQLIQHYLSGNADGMSLPLMAVWLMGDISSLIGGIMMRIPPPAIALSMYLCFSDIILIAQATYYRIIGQKDRQQTYSYIPTEESALLISDAHRHGRAGFDGKAGDAERISYTFPQEGETTTALQNIGVLLAVWGTGFFGYFLSNEFIHTVGKAIINTSTEESPITDTATGLILGYVGAMCYICTRLPQIMNIQRGSTQGLAVLFILFSMTGNFTYAMTVLTYSQDRCYILNVVPWILGSFGMLLEDTIILCQIIMFSARHEVFHCRIEE